MKKLLCSLQSVLIASTVYFSPCALTGAGLAHAQAQQSTKESVRVPAMRNRVYTQFARAQGIADGGDKVGGLAVLDEVKGRIDSLNSYERAMLWNFYGFMHYSADDLPQAMTSFKRVVAEAAIPASLRLSTLYSLAQLSLQQQEYTTALTYLKQWQAVNTKALLPAQHLMFAQVYYQDKQFDKSLDAINNAIDLVSATNALPKENWLILQRANYYELKQPKNVTKVIEQLVRLYSKPQYWIQLAGMYGEIGEEEKQLAVMEAAWQSGYVTKSQDLITLAQLYRYHGAPYKAAKVIDEGIAQGKIVATERHLAALAQAYIAAKDEEKAIPVLIKAAEVSETGKYDAQLAHSYLNLENWQMAAKSADKALERGGISRVGDMHLVLGMSYFNMQDFEQSLHAFKAAENIKTSAKTAKQWYAYVKREQGQYAQIAMLSQ